MDNNNIMDTNNITDNNNIKSIKKKHSFKKKKKARPILSQHGGAKYDFDSRCGIHSKGDASCWMDTCLQMLWDIDCLREYLLSPTSEENIKNLQPITKNAKIIENIKDLITPNHPKFQRLFSKETNFSENVDSPLVDSPLDTDKFYDKVDTILALKSIFETYNSTIANITKLSDDDKARKFKISGDADKKSQEKDTLIKAKLIAVLDDNVTINDTKGVKKVAIDILLGEYNNNQQRDIVDFMDEIFNLFKNINDIHVSNLRKCFTTIQLDINRTRNHYTLSNPNILKLDPDIVENDSVQSLLDRTYTHNENTGLIPFKETKFILLEIPRGNDYEGRYISNPCNININISISECNYKLRGTIIRTASNGSKDDKGMVQTSGHYLYYTYDDNGKIAVVLNGSVKSLHADFIEGLAEKDKRQYEAETNGLLFLYELDDPAKLATTLGAVIAAVGEADTSQPDTNVAAALTATIAATQVGPDAIEEANVPAALTATLAANQLPAPTQPPTHVIKQLLSSRGRGDGRGDGRGTSDIGRGRGDGRGRGRGDGRGRGRGDGSSGNGSGNGSSGNGSDDSANRGSGLHLQKRTQPPVEEKVVEKPYSGSLEPSSDSNGENMVLGILLVITLAISGVLFVQR